MGMIAVGASTEKRLQALPSQPEEGVFMQKRRSEEGSRKATARNPAGTVEQRS
jgi:hypothetical protein